MISLKQGINMQDITKLKIAGICTILGVAQTTRKNLLKIKVSAGGILFHSLDLNTAMLRAKYLIRP